MRYLIVYAVWEIFPTIVDTRHPPSVIKKQIIAIKRIKLKSEMKYFYLQNPFGCPTIFVSGMP